MFELARQMRVMRQGGKRADWYRLAQMLAARFFDFEALARNAPVQYLFEALATPNAPALNEKQHRLYSAVRFVMALQNCSISKACRELSKGGNYTRDLWKGRKPQTLRQRYLESSRIVKERKKILRAHEHEHRGR
jgi:hypothetical protein